MFEVYLLEEARQVTRVDGSGAIEAGERSRHTSQEEPMWRT